MSALYHNLIYRFKERMVYSCFIKDVKSVFCTFFPGSVCRSADMLARPNTRSALPWRVRKFTAVEEKRYQ